MPVTLADARGARLDVSLVDTLHDHVTGDTTLVLREKEHMSETTRAGLVLFGAGGGLAVFMGVAALFTGIPVIMSPTNMDMSRYWRAEGTFALVGLGSMVVGVILILARLPFRFGGPSSGPGDVRVVAGE